MKFLPDRKPVVVPKRVGKEPRFALAVQIESRNGTMIKDIPGMGLFGLKDVSKVLYEIGPNNLKDERIGY